MVVGLRYFNVYGPREAHKGDMSSIVMQLDDQLASSGRCRLFDASHGVGPGEQRRDLVHVDDVVAVVLWFLEHRTGSGVYDCGTGTSTSFNEVARLVLRAHPGGTLEYVPFPAALRATYQWSTRADLERLRSAGYLADFIRLADGVESYLAWRRARGEVPPRRADHPDYPPRPGGRST
jgi:ADP-L-glycero-D-manno-heptose 6-epimerase